MMPSEGLSYFNFMFEPEITILLNPTSVGSIVNWKDGERPLHNYKTNVKRGEELSALCYVPSADVRCDLRGRGDV